MDSHNCYHSWRNMHTSKRDIASVFLQDTVRRCLKPTFTKDTSHLAVLLEICRADFQKRLLDLQKLCGSIVVSGLLRLLFVIVCAIKHSC